MAWVKRMKCSAKDCPYTYEMDSSIKFFSIPKRGKSPEELQRRVQDWKDAVGGFTPDMNKNAFFCQYHFPENQFNDRFRTSLNKLATPAFPFGPINPVTNDFCPMNLNPENTYSDVKCCVPGCQTVGGGGLKLHRFPLDDKKALKIWIQRIYGDFKLLSERDCRSRLVVCQRHFIDDAIVRTMGKSTKSVVRLKSGALPVRLLPFYNGLVSKENSLLHLCMASDSTKHTVTSKIQPEPPTNKFTGKRIAASERKSPEHSRTTYKKVKLETEKQAESDRNLASDESDNSNVDSVKSRTKVFYWSPEDFQMPNRRHGGHKVKGFEPNDGTVVQKVTLKGAAEERIGRSRDKTLLDLCDIDLVDSDDADLSEQSGRSDEDPSEDSRSTVIFMEDLSSNDEQGLKGKSSCDDDQWTKRQKTCSSESIFKRQLYKFLKRLFSPNLGNELLKTNLNSVLRDICTENVYATLRIADADYISKCFKGALHNLSQSGSNQSELSENTKKCLIALNSWSGRVYESLRTIFKFPSVGEVRNWGYHKDGSAGFTEKSFGLILNDILKCEGIVIACMSVQEIPITKDISWNGHRLHGLVDFGFGNIDNDNLPEATRALVFVATALNRPWTLPLGYCLVNNLSPQMKSNLILQYFAKLGTVGTKCIALALEYSPSTYDTLQQLGAVHDPEIPFHGSFPHPTSPEERVYCFVDTFDLMKSVEHFLAEKGSFQNVKWQHLANFSKALPVIRNDPRLKGPLYKKTAIELSRLESHLRLNSGKINKYAARVMKMLKFLKIEGFQNSAETIQFVEQISYIYDILTIFHPFNKISLSTNDVFQTLIKLNSSLKYVRGLLSTKMESTRMLPLMLLCSNLNSLKELITQIERDELDSKFIFTERLSLSNSRKLISKLTSEGLLSALEFQRAYGHFVKNASIYPSDQINFSRNVPPTVDPVWPFCQSFSYQFSPFNSQSDDFTSYLFKSSINQYLTSSKCPDCHWIILKHRERYHQIDFEGGNILLSVYQMFKRAETILYEWGEILENAYDAQFGAFANRILNSLEDDEGFLSESHLFNSAAFGETTHFTVLIKDLLSIFLEWRLRFAPRHTQVGISKSLFGS